MKIMIWGNFTEKWRVKLMDIVLTISVYILIHFSFYSCLCRFTPFFFFFQTNDKFKLPSDRNHLPTNFWISQIFKCASYSTAETHFCSGKTHFCWAKTHFRQLKHTFVQVKHTFVDGSLKRLQLCMFDYCFYRQQVRICHL